MTDATAPATTPRTVVATRERPAVPFGTRRGVRAAVFRRGAGFRTDAGLRDAVFAAGRLTAVRFAGFVRGRADFFAVARVAGFARRAAVFLPDTRFATFPPVWISPAEAPERPCGYRHARAPPLTGVEGGAVNGTPRRTKRNV